MDPDHRVRSSYEPNSPAAEWTGPAPSACPLSRGRLSADGRSPRTAGPCARPGGSALCAPPSSASPAAASPPGTGTGAGRWTGPRCAAWGQRCAPEWNGSWRQLRRITQHSFMQPLISRTAVVASGLGNISISYIYRDVGLYIVLDFGDHYIMMPFPGF